MVRKSGHPLGVTGRMLLGAAITTVGMGLSSGVVAAEPGSGNETVSSTEDTRSKPPMDVRTMTDSELGAELGRVYGKDSLREQEVVTELKARGTQFWEAAPPPSGIGISGGIPVRPGVSVTGTLAYDPYTGSWITSGGVRVGRPTGPQFTGIAPRPDGLNVSGNVTVDLGKQGELSSTLSVNLAPDWSVSGSYTAKGTVTTPDGRSYETDVRVERNADGTVSVELPDGVTTSTPLPGGGTVETTTPADPTEERPAPEVKGPAPKAGEEKPGGWFAWSGAASVDKEIRPTEPLPTAEEVDRARQGWAEQSRAARQEREAWLAQNRPEARYREALELAEQRARAAEQAHRAALPDRDHDGLPDEEDATWNQNDTDPASSDLGDGPESGQVYSSDRVESPAPASPPGGDDPGADYDRDGVPDGEDATWNQNDTDPASADVGDGPESGQDYGISASDVDGDGLTGSADATPNQNDTDPASTDLGDGPEGGEGYGGTDTDSGSFNGDLSDGTVDSGTSGTGTDSGGYSSTGTTSGGYSGTSDDAGGYSAGDVDGDGLSGSADSTPNQNDTDPASTDVGDGPEGNAGYGDCACG